MSDYIYLLSNPSMPNVYKLGKTNRTPDERSLELFTTGVPTPFDIEISFNVSDCDYSERKIFEILGDYRVSNRREFVKGLSIEEIIRRILPALGNFEVYSQKTGFNVQELKQQIEIKRVRINQERKERRKKEDKAKKNVQEFIDAYYKHDYKPFVELLDIIDKYFRAVKTSEPPAYRRILLGIKYEKYKWVEYQYKNNHEVREGFHTLIERFFVKSRRARHFYFMLHRKHEEEYKDWSGSVWSSEWGDYVGHDLWSPRAGSDMGILSQISKTGELFLACEDLMEYEFLHAVCSCLRNTGWDNCLQILRQSKDLQKLIRKYRKERPPEEILGVIKYY